MMPAMRRARTMKNSTSLYEAARSAPASHCSRVFIVARRRQSFLVAQSNIEQTKCGSSSQRSKRLPGEKDLQRSGCSSSIARPNKRFKPTLTPPLRSGASAAYRKRHPAKQGHAAPTRAEGLCGLHSMKTANPAAPDAAHLGSVVEPELRYFKRIIHNAIHRAMFIRDAS